MQLLTISELLAGKPARRPRPMDRLARRSERTARDRTQSVQALDLAAIGSDNDTPLRRVEYWQDMDGRAKDLGVVWTLRKGPHTAICILQAHPLGTGGRVLIDGDLQQTQAFRNTSTMVDTTTSWREAFEAKGWAER